MQFLIRDLVVIMQFLIEIFLMSQVGYIDNCGKCCPCEKNDDNILHENTVSSPEELIPATNIQSEESNSETNTQSEKLNSEDIIPLNVGLKNPHRRDGTTHPIFRGDIKDFSMGSIKNLEVAKIDEFLSGFGLRLEINTENQLKKMIQHIGKTGKHYRIPIQDTKLIDGKQDFQLEIQNSKKVEFIELSAGKDKNHINIRHIMFENF